MLKDLSTLPDRSCWISGSRINACIGEGGIIEAGYHGLQPVSRNSRMLVLPEGAITFCVSGPAAPCAPVRFTHLSWEPSRVRTPVGDPQALRWELIATGRSIAMLVAGDVRGMSLIVRLDLRSCFTDVRGERVWEEPVIAGSTLRLCCRDRLLLGPWMRRTGPYAGDFLIPEHWRRRIFNRPIRSGLATPEDLLPEYRDADIPIYDAQTWLVLDVPAGSVDREGEAFLLRVPLDRCAEGEPVFTLTGTPEDPAVTAHHPPDREQVAAVLTSSAALDASTPRLHAEGLPSLSAFFATVPGLVRSATVDGEGMTRATPGAYYWLWAWDNLVTAHEALRWGAGDLAASVVRFIGGHRDVNDAIPARWTRKGEPMDTPPRGALEFLQIHLAYAHALEAGDTTVLRAVYPAASAFLREADERNGGTGLLENMSFYPDRPVAFGRTERSVVALETGCLYVFARLMDNIAGLIGAGEDRARARTLAAAIEGTFLTAFWDRDRGFLIDSFDAATGARNRAFPLFTLLFLQTPLGRTLIRPVLPAMARFLRHELQAGTGTRLLPSWDERRSGEDALGSWYPHWDIYLLSVLRQAGDREGILRWASAAERLVGGLGYVPEFIVLDAIAGEPGPAWLRHGAVSNLNCVTGWYRAILEGIAGLETDPGGLSVVPTGHPGVPLHLQGLAWRGGRWDIEVRGTGAFLASLSVDGLPVRGTTKVPVRYHDGGAHTLAVRYGDAPAGPTFSAIVNAEVLDAGGDARSATVTIRPLGVTDIVFQDPDRVRCTVDGRPAVPDTAPDQRSGWLRIEDMSVHELSLSLRA